MSCLLITLLQHNIMVQDNLWTAWRQLNASVHTWLGPDPNQAHDWLIDALVD